MVGSLHHGELGLIMLFSNPQFPRNGIKATKVEIQSGLNVCQITIFSRRSACVIWLSLLLLLKSGGEDEHEISPRYKKCLKEKHWMKFFNNQEANLEIRIGENRNEELAFFDE